MSAAAMAEHIDASIAKGAVARELWSSFVSLVRSYTAAHGLNGTRQAVLEVSDGLLLVRAGDRLLTIRFDGERGSYARETGAATAFTLDEHGRLDMNGGSEGPGDPEEMDMNGGSEGPGDPEEMDMVAERLAREIMR